jgi:hypothetical protein
MKELKVSVENGIQELIIREGVARPEEPKKTVSISGQIESPSIYLKQRTAQVQPGLSHVIVNRGKMLITLYVNEDLRFGNTYDAIISGHAKLSDDLDEFSINKDSVVSLKTMSSFLKKKRYFFLDKEDNAKIVSELLGFKMKVEKTIEKNEDTRGNYAAAIQKTLDTGTLSKGFKLSISVFSGMKPSTFWVDICVDEREGQVICWLESAELADVILDLRDKMMTEVIKKFDGFVVIEE